MDEDVWEGLYPFQSVSFNQRFLKQCYLRSRVAKPEAQSYRNSYPFLYYLQHGKAHYKLAHAAAFSLQPLLLFYGMTHLVKACLLTADPEYPKTTAVLAHGVSTRKKKKKAYAFIDDEILIQKRGLAVHLAEKLYGMTGLEGEKWNMKHLLERIPDLNGLFKDLYDQQPFCPVNRNTGNRLEVPAEILDHLNMTFSRFIEFLSIKLGLNMTDCEEKTKILLIQAENPPFYLPSSLSGQLYLPRSRDAYDLYPEMLVHYLLLYNLSMIARYETEWWSELFHQASEDYPLIDKFLDVTKKKVPMLVSRYLRKLM